MTYNKYVEDAMSTSKLANELSLLQQNKLAALARKDFQDLHFIEANIQDIRQGMLIDVGLGLTGEAGEVADHIKKHVSMGHPMDFDKMDLEVGDVVWYVAEYCKLRGITFEELQEKNIQKLQKRYPDRKFNLDHSLNRSE